MPLDAAELQLIADLVRQGPTPARVLSFGHPDILATPEEVAPILGGLLLPIDNVRVRAERLDRTREDCVGSAFGFFAALGAELVVIDRRDLFGIDDRADLNYPIALRHHSDYSLVIDPGTIEHVMNVGQALVSALAAARVGGYIYHANPMVMLNHGYWNFSPVAYHDFYIANGCEILRLQGRRKGRWFDVPATGRFSANLGGGGKLVLCIARKLRETDQIVWPMQSKYSR